MPSFKDVRPWVLTPLVASDSAASRVPHGNVGEQAPEVTDPDLLGLAGRAEARAEGFRDGYEEGLRRANEEQRAAVHALASMAEHAARETDDFFRAVEREAVQLSMAIAEKVVQRELRLDPGVVLDVVRSALEEIRGVAVVHVRVNPADYELVASHWREVAPSLSGEHDPLVADDRISPGGCVIETSAGQVDAQIVSKLGRLSETLSALLDGEPA